MVLISFLPFCQTIKSHALTSSIDTKHCYYVCKREKEIDGGRKKKKKKKTHVTQITEIM